MSYDNYEILDDGKSVVEQTKAFFANVYKYMFLALSISGVLAYISAESGWYVRMAFNPDGGMAPMGWVIMFAPLALVLFIQARVNKMNFSSILGLYILYSVLIGVSLSFIFLIYSGASIVSTFFITAGTFGAMALIGYTTKVDLSKMGSILYMVFIGMFIASIANIWMGSSTMGWIISFLGLFVFTGLTAWQMQKLRIIAMSPEITGEVRKKEELMGGLMLYILFINLFLTILRFVDR
jgi:FtsH-binding integral membrane protein